MRRMESTRWRFMARATAPRISALSNHSRQLSVMMPTPKRIPNTTNKGEGDSNSLRADICRNRSRISSCEGHGARSDGKSVNFKPCRRSTGDLVVSLTVYGGCWLICSYLLRSGSEFIAAPIPLAGRTPARRTPAEAGYVPREPTRASTSTN